MRRTVFDWLWSLARYFPSVAPSIRFGSGASVLLTFLFFVCFLAGLGLVLLGFDLTTVDAWLERQAWLGATADFAFNCLVALTGLAGIGLMALPFLRDEDGKRQAGAGALFVGALLAFFCLNNTWLWLTGAL